MADDEHQQDSFVARLSPLTGTTEISSYEFLSSFSFDAFRQLLASRCLTE